MTRKRGGMETRRITLSALLLAMMLILGYVESLLPLNVGVPGIKLGLSNSVLIFAVYMLDAPTGFLLMALKVLLSGMLFSGPSTMMYGFAGGVLSMAGMVLLSRTKLPAVAVSVAGGMLHNAGQVGMSLVILQVPFSGMAGYLLVLLGVGAVCGALTGVCATAVMKHLKALGWRDAERKTDARRKWALAAAVVLLVGAAALWYLKPWQRQEVGSTVIWEETTSTPAPHS